MVVVEQDRYRQGTNHGATQITQILNGVTVRFRSAVSQRIFEHVMFKKILRIIKS